MYSLNQSLSYSTTKDTRTKWKTRTGSRKTNEPWIIITSCHVILAAGCTCSLGTFCTDNAKLRGRRDRFQALPDTCL